MQALYNTYKYIENKCIEQDMTQVSQQGGSLK